MDRIAKDEMEEWDWMWRPHRLVRHDADGERDEREYEQRQNELGAARLGRLHVYGVLHLALTLASQKQQFARPVSR